MEKVKELKQPQSKHSLDLFSDIFFWKLLFVLLSALSALFEAAIEQC